MFGVARGVGKVALGFSGPFSREDLFLGVYCLVDDWMHQQFGISNASRRCRGRPRPNSPTPRSSPSSWSANSVTVPANAAGSARSALLISVRSPVCRKTAASVAAPGECGSYSGCSARRSSSGQTPIGNCGRCSTVSRVLCACYRRGNPLCPPAVPPSGATRPKACLARVPSATVAHRFGVHWRSRVCPRRL